MDCTSVTTRVAAFLDGELGPAEAEQFAAHLEGCSACMRIVIRLERQEFTPLDESAREAICSRDGFWGDMESVLDTHLDQMVLAKTAPSGPWFARRLALPVPMVAAYAAALVLAVVWGVQQQERATSAEMASDHLGQQLESERRLAAQPTVPTTPATETYKAVNYTPERGTF